MGWTAPRTYVTGEVVTAAILNADHRDNLLALRQSPLVRVRRSTAQSIGNAAWTAISWNVEEKDNDTMWASGTPTRLVATQAGEYLLTATVAFATNSTGTRYVAFRKSSSGLAQAPQMAQASANPFGRLTTTYQVALAAGEYMEVIVYQDSTGSLNLQEISGTEHQIRAAMIWQAA